ncbi:MAG: hypothetical protein V3V18_02820 [Methylococcales bacterium]
MNHIISAVKSLIPVNRCYLFFLLLFLYGCSDNPEFKPLDQYDPVSIKIGKAYVQNLVIDEASDQLNPDVNLDFKKTFKNMYGVNVENAAIACAERDVTTVLAEDNKSVISEKWVNKAIDDSELNLSIGNHTIRDLLSDCLTPMAKKAYKKINNY